MGAPSQAVVLIIDLSNTYLSIGLWIYRLNSLLVCLSKGTHGSNRFSSVKPSCLIFKGPEAEPRGQPALSPRPVFSVSRASGDHLDGANRSF